MNEFLRHQIEVYFLENPDDAARIAEQVLINKRQLDRALGGTAMLQKAGIVVILSLLHPVGKTTGHIQLDLVFRLVLPVAASALGLPKLQPSMRPSIWMRKSIAMG